jgi:hypothetical protein
MNVTKQLRIVASAVLLTSALSSAGYRTPKAKWSISSLNGYPYYSDAYYNTYSLGFRHKELGYLAESCAQFIVLNVGLVPQPRFTYHGDQWDYAVELRSMPSFNHNLFGPKMLEIDWEPWLPHSRSEFVSSFLVGKRLIKNNWKHNIMLGYSHRWEMHTNWWYSPHQDFFGTSTNMTHDPGLILKYELTRSIGQSLRWEIGVGVNYARYRSGIHVTNLGLVFSRKMGRLYGRHYDSF